MAAQPRTPAGAPQRSSGKPVARHLTAWSPAVVIVLSWLTGGAKADPLSTAAPLSAVPSPRPGSPNPTPSSEIRNLPEVTIEADRAAIERRVYAFVSHVTHGPVESEDESLVLWHTAICPLVAGLPREQGEFVLGRVSQIVASAGAPLAPQDCRPNFYVIVTSEPELLLKTWRARDEHVFGDAWRKTIKKFTKKSRPVRVWYNAETNSAAGQPLSFSSTLGLGTSVDGSAFATAPTNTDAHVSRLEFNEVLSFGSVIAIIDTNDVKGLELRQVADYVAMAGLTRLDLDADVGDAPTILRLFNASGEAAPQGLSGWDQSFLKALYHTRQSSRGQRAEITHHMLRDIAP